MDNVESTLNRIEKEFARDPDKIWEYLREDDLLLTTATKSNNTYIICVNRYVQSKGVIKIKFLYSVKNDLFFPDEGFEYTDKVDRGAFFMERDKLYGNLDYLTYISSLE